MRKAGGPSHAPALQSSAECTGKARAEGSSMRNAIALTLLSRRKEVAVFVGNGALDRPRGTICENQAPLK